MSSSGRDIVKFSSLNNDLCKDSESRVVNRLIAETSASTALTEPFTTTQLCTFKKKRNKDRPSSLIRIILANMIKHYFKIFKYIKKAKRKTSEIIFKKL